MELIRHCLFDRKIHTSSSCSCNIIERNIIQGKFSTQLYIALQAMIICEENKRFMIAQIIFNTPVCMICVMSASRNHYPLSYDVLGCKSFPFKFIVFWKITKWTTIFASHCIKIYISYSLITVPVGLESWLEYYLENLSFYLIKNGKNSNTLPLKKWKK